MHFAVLVITPEDSSVEEALAPYRRAEWDSFVVGGRFSGLLDGYAPEKDPDNSVRCELCDGTGTRTELPSPIETSKMQEGEWITEMDYSRTTREYMEGQGGCNGCGGKGMHLKAPSDWKEHAADRILLADLTAEQYEGKFYAVCICNIGWFSSERYVPWAPEDQKVNAQELPPLEWLKQQAWTGDLAYVVDCHC